MTTTDWIIDITLVLIVLRQVRTSAFGWHTVLLPLGIAAWVGGSYLEALPTGGNDLALIGAGLVVGTLLGVAGGLTTKVWAVDGRAQLRAGVTAATLWVASMGARLAFIVWASHSSGEAALARFSAAHDITGAAAWTDALVLLALSEVVVRIGIIAVRAVRINARGTDARPADRALVAA